MTVTKEIFLETETSYEKMTKDTKKIDKKYLKEALYTSLRALRWN